MRVYGSLVDGGQHDGEGGAETRAGAVGGEAAVVVFDDGARDGEAQSAATVGLVGARGVESVEALEDRFELVCGDAGAGVGDRDRHRLIHGGGGHGDVTTGWGVA